MKREIKFRAYDTERKIYMPQGEIIFKDYGETYFEVSPNCQEYVHDKCHNGEPQYNRFVIEQFTGLYDSNNKPVYEGDILEIVYYNHTGKNCKLIQEVYYLEESGCFCVRTVGKEVSPIENDRNNVPLSWTSQPNTISYLGNIHENPELLCTSQST